jgi:signal transduction histidine kinase
MGTFCLVLLCALYVMDVSMHIFHASRSFTRSVVITLAITTIVIILICVLFASIMLLFLPTLPQKLIFYLTSLIKKLNRSFHAKRKSYSRVPHG